MSTKIIEYLYPEVSNLYGDPFNVKYLAESIKENGCEVELIRDELNRAPFFANSKPDFVYMGPMTEHSQELVIDRLMPHTERIKQLISEGVVFLITGNALEIFADRIENEDGTAIKALGLYPFVAKRRMFNRYNSLFLGEFEGIKIVANKSQFSHCYGDSTKKPFIKVLRGDGIAPGEQFEGIKDNNFMATYLLGPLLVLNPMFTRKILEFLGIDNARVSYEEESVKAYEIRLKEFENENTELS